MLLATTLNRCVHETNQEQVTGQASEEWKLVDTGPRVVPSMDKECRKRGQSHRPGEERSFLDKATVMRVLTWTP